MAPCSVVLILAGIYATHSRSIKMEIDLAENGFSFPKPIVAIKPHGSKKSSRIAKCNADRVVGWNTESIVKAIRELA